MCEIIMFMICSISIVTYFVVTLTKQASFIGGLYVTVNLANFHTLSKDEIFPLQTTHGSTRSCWWHFRHLGPKSQWQWAERSQQGVFITGSQFSLQGTTTSFSIHWLHRAQIPSIFFAVVPAGTIAPPNKLPYLPYRIHVGDFVNPHIQPPHSRLQDVICCHIVCQPHHCQHLEVSEWDLVIVWMQHGTEWAPLDGVVQNPSIS